nr:ComF family protein [Desulfobulbus alkaliphilus]
MFPPTCLGCTRRLATSRPPFFCADCLAEVVYLGSPCCACCGIPFPTGVDHLCGDCLVHPPAFDVARSVLLYQPPVATVLRTLKFGGQLTGLTTLGALASQSPFMHHFTPPDYIVPVPLHLSRLRQRGFNQARSIAAACFPHWQDRIKINLLLRNRPTVPQTDLSGEERRKNLKNAFIPVEDIRFAKKRILLVDDIFTTGSTVSECSLALRRAGVARIEVFTLARSLAP